MTRMVEQVYILKESTLTLYSHIFQMHSLLFCISHCLAFHSLHTQMCFYKANHTADISQSLKFIKYSSYEEMFQILLVKFMRYLFCIMSSPPNSILGKFDKV